jgi:hypothetical protein
MTPVQRATALIRKAVSTESEAEARTCAFLAVKIIVREKLELTLPGQEPRPRPRTARERERHPAHAPSRTSYHTDCLFCGEHLNPGDKVFWSKAFNVMVCAECFETEILVKTRMEDLGRNGRRRT